MPTQLERLFHNEMLHIYERARTECHYTATRFLQMVVEQGGLSAAKALLHGKGLSEGLQRLCLEGRLDLSMEALILRSPWRESGFFTTDDLEVAAKRLRDLGYEPPH